MRIYKEQGQKAGEAGSAKVGKTKDNPAQEEATASLQWAQPCGTGPSEGESVFVPGRNCWQTGRADRAAFLIDCAHYYRALYHTLCQAKRTIFIIGWDIDGRIEMLRGKDAEEAKLPVGFFQLICRLASDNPELKIYLDRWNYSIFYAKEREPFSGWKWKYKTPENVYYNENYSVPFGGSHHQKIIVVDDKIAFCGGMDIALNRWDIREHYVQHEGRKDPGGWFSFYKLKEYQPYHDIQLIMSGPVVGVFSKLARQRWKQGSGFDAPPAAQKSLRGNKSAARDDVEINKDGQENSAIWPHYLEPDFEHVELAVARTWPQVPQVDTIREIQQAYIDQICRAEKFIYIENQYLTCPEIAYALNRRLKEKEDLRVLAVSSDHPRGVLEHKSMWTGRVQFTDIVMDGVDKGRFKITYPVSEENGTRKTIHIHSKLLITDDRYIEVGSANLNNRSMGFDSECDVIIEARDEKTKNKIRALRNDLIREHTGRELKDIDELISCSDLEGLLDYQDHSRQHLVTVDDSPYRGEFLTPLAKKIGDPKEPLIPFNFPVRQTIFFTSIAAVLALIVWIFLWPHVPKDFDINVSKDALTGFIESARSSSWSPLIIMGVYILAGMLFFSVMALNLATAIVFGPFYGFLYAYLGSMSSACVGYGVGRTAGVKLSRWLKPIIQKVRGYCDKGGILGLTLIRMVPIAPFMAMNITLGVAKAKFGAYMISTFLGLLPGIAAKALFGGALGKLFTNPTPEVIAYTVAALCAWIAIIWGSHSLYKKLSEKSLSS